MAYMTKREADEFRREIKKLLDEPLRWGGYEDQREWLWRLLRVASTLKQIAKMSLGSLTPALPLMDGQVTVSPNLAKGLCHALLI
jgi:hypothetical protein